jgi:hypothetical protein
MTVLINVNTASMQVSLALFHLGNSGFQPLFGEGIEPVLQKPAELIDLLLQIFALFTHGLAALDHAGAQQRAGHRRQTGLASRSSQGSAGQY